MRDTVAERQRVLFVGTKRQAQETIEAEAVRCGMPYVNNRWLGGTLTNWRTIHSRIDELANLEKGRDAGEFEKLTKKEALVPQPQDRTPGRAAGRFANDEARCPGCSSSSTSAARRRRSTKPTC